MRPKQWTKNIIFVFPALIFDRKFSDLDAFIRVLIACVLLILMAGTVYIINDLVDIDKDRQHPTKKNRPLPSGELPIGLAKLAAIIIPLGTLAFAVWWDWPSNGNFSIGFVLLIYLLIQIAYSFYLKNIVL